MWAVSRWQTPLVGREQHVQNVNTKKQKEIYVYDVQRSSEESQYMHDQAEQSGLFSGLTYLMYTQLQCNSL